VTATSSAGGFLRAADGVVQEDLVRPGLDDQGRQARQVSEYRADEAEGEAGIGDMRKAAAGRGSP